MTIKIELMELMMTPHSKQRSVIKNNQHDWLDMLLSEIKYYNNWVADRNERLSKQDDGTTTFHEPPIRNLLDEEDN